ncbi:MAG TPA: hypothetical protein P5052_00780 [Candidatus Paceibacterota bacterium]|nr:hypothetical protein [Candidatus Paceibacterota bacterium]
MKNDYQIVGNGLCTEQAKKFGFVGEFEAIFDLNLISKYVYRSIKPKKYIMDDDILKDGLTDGQKTSIQSKGLIYKNLYCDGRYVKFFDVFNCSKSTSGFLENSIFCQLPNLSELLQHRIIDSVWNRQSFHECEQLFTVADCSEKYSAFNKPYTSNNDKVYGRTLKEPLADCRRINP